jgi:hypothetical protein
MKYLQRILLSLLGILILVYIGYQIFRGTTYSNVKTETAIYGTLWNTVSVRAAAVRDETLIEGGGSDAIISYTAPNGSHVPAGGAVATIYQSEREVKNALRIAELERENKRLNDEYQQMWKKKRDADQRLQQANELLGENDRNNSARRDIEQLTIATNSYLRNYGGKVWAFDQFDRVDEPTQQEFIKAITSLAAFAQNMAAMVGERN